MSDIVITGSHVPSADRMGDPSAWEENDRLRTEASAAVARGAAAALRAGTEAWGRIAT